MVSYANQILKSEQKEKVIDRISMKVLNSFRNGTPEVREESARVLDSLELFFDELNIIVAEDEIINE